MKMRTMSIACILTIQMILIACSASVTEISIGVDDEYLNNQVLVSAPEYFNSYRTFDPIVLEIRSYSNNEIRFPNNFNLRIFKQVNNKWVEIMEKPITRLPEGDVLFSPQSSTMKDLAVLPELDDYSTGCKLRIYVIGDMKTDDQNKKVAAYADIELKP